MIIEKIETMLRDYPWMKKEVGRLERIIYGYSTPMKSWGVAQYGIEATLPKGSPGKSQAELRDMDIREERQYKRLMQLRERVYALEMAADLLDDEKERVIYDCMLDGMSFREISYHIGVSRNQVKKTKEAILSQLSQKSQFVQLLNLEKSAC
ncbi:sigma-70 family RNA polymerase sigma factor [Peribacillus asahii]|uniref:sigma-70 family RNA polymerase sigma factor n=1 Tax=Peribacillus asahii TaxID=228899 RepID=UPI00207A12C9|nr:sigma-70 family RNA polymerase sigma factor [Peribacillus asahii]USK61320.1 sigma-70 family RNA polymerase sigma factor [Peribacillus asahii]